jgi:hypothetical protein
VVSLEEVRGDTYRVDDVYVRRSPALWRRAPGYLSVAAVDGSSVQMGGSAGAVWDLLPHPGAEPRSLGSLVAALAARFDTTSAFVERDVIEVLDALESLGCVVRVA